MSIKDLVVARENSFVKTKYGNYDPPNEVGGSCFCLVRPASVRGVKKIWSKTRFRGFWVCFGCFWRFRLLSVRPSSRPSGQWMGYVLCRELVLGFWGSEPETNLKWLNIYWSCAPPILDVRLDHRSVRGVWTQMILHVAYGNTLCFVQRTCPRVLWFGTRNQPEMNKYILKLCTSYCGRPSRPSVGLREVWA